MEKILLFLSIIAFNVSNAQIITTIAGNGSYGSSGDGGPATDACFSPWSCVIDKNSCLYFSDQVNNVIRKIDNLGTITTIAGTGSSGYNGDGIPATMAQLDLPGDLTVDKYGNILFLDLSNYRIRKIDATTHIITTIAGNGSSGSWVNGTNVTSSGIGYCNGFCMDKFGNKYISNPGRVAKIDTSGVLSILAGSVTGIPSVPFFAMPVPALSVYFSPYIQTICVDTACNIYIGLNYTIPFTSTVYSSILKVDTAGILSQYAGNGYCGYTGDGGSATTVEININGGLTCDKNENLYFSSYKGIRSVSPSGTICTVAGNGVVGFSGDSGLATAAQVYNPQGLTTDSSCNLIFSDMQNNRIRKVTNPTCGNITGVVPVHEKSLGISISPNPLSDKLNISSEDVITSIVILDQIGHQVYAKSYYATHVCIDLASLACGVYFLKVNDSEIRMLVKL